MYISLVSCLLLFMFYCLQILIKKYLRKAKASTLLGGLVSIIFILFSFRLTQMSDE